ncbi:MAG: helix-turn-helix transcriptional regulator [Alphaproteobacteria bacterium]|nr:helix-turn-helix transcriptional regulator [Alphaproteobacteria bacterium]
MLKKTQKNITDTVFDIIGDHWKVKIVECLLNGTKRFGELRKSMGNITQKVLTSNLRKLEDKGVLIRKVYAQIPPKVEYRLTAMGKKLKPIIDSMVEWSNEYAEKMGNFSKKLFADKEDKNSSDTDKEENT